MDRICSSRADFTVEMINPVRACGTLFQLAKAVLKSQAKALWVKNAARV